MAHQRRSPSLTFDIDLAAKSFNRPAGTGCFYYLSLQAVNDLPKFRLPLRGKEQFEWAYPLPHRHVFAIDRDFGIVEEHILKMICKSVLQQR